MIFPRTDSSFCCFDETRSCACNRIFQFIPHFSGLPGNYRILSGSRIMPVGKMLADIPTAVLVYLCEVVNLLYSRLFIYASHTPAASRRCDDTKRSPLSLLSGVFLRAGPAVRLPERHCRWWRGQHPAGRSLGCIPSLPWPYLKQHHQQRPSCQGRHEVAVGGG